MICFGDPEFILILKINMKELFQQALEFIKNMPSEGRIDVMQPNQANQNSRTSRNSTSTRCSSRPLQVKTRPRPQVGSK